MEEEEVQMIFREGVLSHLSELETLSHDLSERQERSRRQEDVLQEKRGILLQLKKERDELQEKVKRQREEIQAMSATHEGRRPRRPRPREAMQDLRLEEMKGIMEALWFTGISGQKTDTGYCFCLSTAYDGHYLDSYYVQVDNTDTPSRIVRHSVPIFIPLGKISQHLEGSTKKFLIQLSNHLNGFAGRKFQADRLQDVLGAYVPGSLQANSLHTVISFRYNVAVDGQTFCFSAKLSYGVITGVRPTEVQVTCPENTGPVQEAASSHSMLFRTTPLHRAVESLTTPEDGSAEK
ncbi:centromere protein O isoform 1-T2 [Anomaloglossus baeobatrachus]|uniref:centromere protein O n=1 Tax=Anomaloglossus baeobatrachus TaxID=238106 RepID=UPI003F50A4DB